MGRSKFDWENTPPLKRIKPSRRYVSAADVRRVYEQKLQELLKDPVKNANDINNIHDLLKLIE